MNATATDWMADALCAQVGGDVFFPEVGEPNRPAKRVCQTCSVRSQCLEWALATHQAYGIWGGMSYVERRRMQALRLVPELVGSVPA